MTFTREKLNWGLKHGVVKGVTLRADGNAFEVVIHTKEGDEKLVITRKATTASQDVRRFPNPGTALRLLYSAGVSNIQIDLAQWKPQARGEPFDRARSERMALRHAATRQTVAAATGTKVNADLADLPEPAAPKEVISHECAEPASLVMQENRLASPDASQGTDIADGAQDQGDRKSPSKSGVKVAMDINQFLINPENF